MTISKTIMTRLSSKQSISSKTVAYGLLFAISSSLILLQHNVHAKEVSVDEYCQIPVIIQANVPEKVKKGTSFLVSNLIIKPSNTYGQTISSSITALTATNTNSSLFRQDFTRTDPTPTTGYDRYIAYYPDWTIDATGEVGSTIEIKLKDSISSVGDLGEIPCTYSKSLATVLITDKDEPEAAASTTPSKVPGVVALRVQVVDNYGRSIKSAEVGVGDSKQKTDENGLATFLNVLTGKKTIYAIDGEDRIQGIFDITKDTTVAKVITLRKPAPPFYQNPLFIGGVIVAVIAIIASITFVIVKRRKASAHNEARTDPTQKQSLSGIIEGSLVANQSISSIIPESDQSESPNKPAQSPLEPWEIPKNAWPSSLPGSDNQNPSEVPAQPSPTENPTASELSASEQTTTPESDQSTDLTEPPTPSNNESSPNEKPDSPTADKQ